MRICFSAPMPTRRGLPPLRWQLRLSVAGLCCLLSGLTVVTARADVARPPFPGGEAVAELDAPARRASPQSGAMTECLLGSPTDNPLSRRDPTAPRHHYPLWVIAAEAMCAAAGEMQHRPELPIEQGKIELKKHAAKIAFDRTPGIDVGPRRRPNFEFLTTYFASRLARPTIEWRTQLLTGIQSARAWSTQTLVKTAVRRPLVDPHQENLARFLLNSHVRRLAWTSWSNWWWLAREFAQTARLPDGSWR